MTGLRERRHAQTRADIVDAAATQGIELEKSEIDMPDGPIRVTGDYSFRVMLHSEVDCQITVSVTEAAAS